MSTWSGVSPLHPKVIEAIFLKKEQGELIGTQFLPERPVGGIEFTYRLYARVGGMSPEIRESAPTPLASVDYEEKVAKCIEVREGDIISERALKFTAGIRDVVKDTVEFITERMMLRKEYRIFSLMNSDLTAFGQPTAITPTNPWEHADETILADLADAILGVKNAGHVKADSLLIGSQEENSIAKADTLVQWNLAGQFGQQQIAEYAVGRLKSLDIYVTDAVVEDDDTPVEGNSALLAGAGTVFKRGPQLGFTAVAEAFMSRQYPVEDRRGIALQMWQTYQPVITRPTHIIRLLSLHA